MSGIISVERIETTLTNGALTTTTNLTKGQDETQCAPFATIRRVLVSSTANSDNMEQNQVDVEIIDNAGTPAVRCSVFAMPASNSILVSVYVVEYGSDITVQQGAFDIVASSTTDLVAVTAVDQTKAFMIHHYTADVSDVDGIDEAAVGGFFSSNSELTFIRGLGPASSAMSGHYYIVEDTASNWDVQSGSFTVTTTGSDTLTAITMAKTFVVASETQTHTVDDISAEAIVELTATTTVTGTRQSNTGTCTIYYFAVTFDSGGAENVYRGTITGTAATGTASHTAIDPDLSVVWSPKRHPTSGYAPSGGSASSDHNQALVGLVLNGTDNGVDMTRSVAQGGSQSITTAWETIEWELAAAGVTATPTKATITHTGNLPLVTASDHKTAVPTEATITHTGNLPLVTASDNQVVVPGKASVIHTGNLPLVGVSDNQTVVPGKAVITHTGNLPIVAVTDHQTVTPSKAIITHTGNLPVVATTVHVTVTPPKAAITHTGGLPLVLLPVVALVGKGSLLHTGALPVVLISDHQLVTPSKAVITHTGNLPVVAVGDPKVAIPGKATITHTGNLPIVTTTAHQLVSPGKGAITHTGKLAIVETPVVVSPGKATITYTGNLPVVTADENVIALPGKATITHTGQLAIVDATAHVSVVPSKATITHTGKSAIVETPVVVAPGKATITHTGKAPVILLPVRTTPGKSTITHTGKAPVVSITQHRVATPTKATITHTGNLPIVRINVSVIPGKASVVHTGKIPVISVSNNTIAQPGKAQITLTGKQVIVVISTEGIGSVLIQDVGTIHTITDQGSIISIVDVGELKTIAA